MLPVSPTSFDKQIAEVVGIAVVTIAGTCRTIAKVPVTAVAADIAVGPITVFSINCVVSLVPPFLLLSFGVQFVGSALFEIVGGDQDLFNDLGQIASAVRGLDMDPAGVPLVPFQKAALSDVFDFVNEPVAKDFVLIAVFTFNAAAASVPRCIPVFDVDVIVVVVVIVLRALALLLEMSDDKFAKPSVPRMFQQGRPLSEADVIETGTIDNIVFVFAKNHVTCAAVGR